MITIKELYIHFKKHPFVSTDSRQIIKDSIFFALKGDNFNGNLYAKEAIGKGASMAIVDDNNFYDPDNNIFFVKDCLKMLQDLASLHRSSFDIPILAITGTNGKTTTKELIASVLSPTYNLIATKGNLNNHIGVPLTLLRISNTTQFAVIEMGANHIGEIYDLCKIAKPNLGIITNIGLAHLEGFGSYEGVIKAKSELYNYIQENNGTLFVNNNDKLLLRLSKHINCILYGVGTDIKAKITDIDPTLKLDVSYKNLEDSENISITSNLAGKYNLDNILAALCIGMHFKVDTNSLISGICNYKPQNIRSQIKLTDTNKLIIDAYNANPSSMQEALENFSEINDTNKLLILGDMFELGDYSESEHRKIIDLIHQFGFEEYILIGKEFSKINVVGNSILLNSVNDLIEYLVNNPQKGKTILIKGSRGIGLEKAIDYL